MTFQEAKAALAELAAGKYHNIKYELATYSNGNTVAECKVYVDGTDYHTGGNWEEALDSLRKSLNVPSGAQPNQEPA